MIYRSPVWIPVYKDASAKSKKAENELINGWELLISDKTCPFYTNIEQVVFHVFPDKVPTLSTSHFVHETNQQERLFITIPNQFKTDTKLSLKEAFSKILKKMWLSIFITDLNKCL